MSLRIYLGHGASGTAASMRPHVDGLVRRGFAASAIDLPKRRAEDAVPALRAVVPNEPDVVIGGHSYGGRVASLAAAEPDAEYSALVLFSFPFHPPGSPDRADARTVHFPRIRCPVLLLSGEADPFARREPFDRLVRLLPAVEVVTWPRVRHGLGPVLDDALDRVADFLARLPGGR